jgi:hypothetical protein
VFLLPFSRVASNVSSVFPQSVRERQRPTLLRISVREPSGRRTSESICCRCPDLCSQLHFPSAASALASDVNLSLSAQSAIRTVRNARALPQLAHSVAVNAEWPEMTNGTATSVA